MAVRSAYSGGFSTTEQDPAMGAAGPSDPITNQLAGLFQRESRWRGGARQMPQKKQGPGGKGNVGMPAQGNRMSPLAGRRDPAHAEMRAFSDARNAALRPLYGFNMTGDYTVDPNMLPPSMRAASSSFSGPALPSGASLALMPEAAMPEPSPYDLPVYKRGLGVRR